MLMESCLLSLYDIDSLKAFSDRGINGYTGANARIRDKQGATVVHQKPGPLQTIFDLHPDEASLRKCF